ncbi:DUF6600 domain-containing protein [Rugamonas apoptosis]|uniref:FecR family protein n=1 Tax=Rugamonas apoptosis TaxID=2758570 RepID=A0A7W2FDX8_9BURK|nr:DUF6600 domain-containing protein [Rugamonas apoptosis]MBA5689849.1 hypothetical protein [Rugamonas apoptosis]
MNMSTPRRLRALLAGILSLMLCGLAAAEPPSRAARLAYISGTVSFSPAGESDWLQAIVNRPLTTGDRLWTDADARAELQIGGAALRLGPATNVTLLNLDDRIAQYQLTQGAMKVRIRHMAPDQSVEVDTPNLAFILRRPGEYRIDADINDNATAVMVLSGQAEVYGDGASYAVAPRHGYRFYGTGLGDYDALTMGRSDDLDRWAAERDRRSDNSSSARYVSAEVVGYEDLDAYGSWRSDPTYGNVWMPTRVAAGWTPYRDGHWAWVDPWGWTWVDDAPWGFAVSHYGRWANLQGSWAWVPGPPREAAVYAPALVVFIGGRNFQASASVGWFPLAPREVYRPSYPVSRGYFDQINRSNAVIAPTIITSVYNTTNVTNITNTTNVTNVVYANQQVNGAVVAVPTQAFVRSQPVARAAVAVSKEVATSAPVMYVAAVAPVQQSVHGAAPAASAKPPALERAVVAHAPPPPAPIAFAAQQAQLAAKPGIPIDESRRAQLKPAAQAAAPKISLVSAAKAPAPSALPPPTAPAARSPEARKAEASRSDATQGMKANADAATANTSRAEASRTAATAAEASRADAAKTEAAKTDAAKADAAKAATARAEALKAEAAKADNARAEAMKADAARAAAARAEASRAEAANAENARAEAMKADAARAAATRAEASRAEAANAENARAEAMKADAARAAATRAEASRAEAAKAENARAEAMKADAARAAATRAEASRAEAAKAENARAEAMKADAARAAAARAEASRAEAARAENARAEAMKADAARAAAARAEASRAEAARAENARAETMKADATRAAAARTEASRGEAARPPSSRASPPAPPPEAHGRTPKKSESEAKTDAEKISEEDAQKR